MWKFLLQNCRKFIPTDVMFCGDITNKPLTGMEGGKESPGKVTIKSDYSPVDTREQERRMDETGFNCQGDLGNSAW